MIFIEFPPENTRIKDISWVSGGAKKGNRIESISKIINGRFLSRIQAEVLIFVKETSMLSSSCQKYPDSRQIP